MGTIITKRIDGYNIVVGFDTLVRDPVASNELADKLLEKEGWHDRLGEKSDVVAKKNYELQQTKITKPPREQVAMLRVAVERLIGEYGMLIQEYGDRRKDIMRENPVYFEPKLGESNICNDDLDNAKKMFQDCPPDCKIAALIETDQSGNKWKFKKILNLRNRSYYVNANGKWSKHTILKLG